MDKEKRLSEFLISVISNIPYGIIAIDMKGNILLANKMVKRYLALNTSADEMTDLSIFPFIEEIEELQAELKKCLSDSRRSFDLFDIIYNYRLLYIRGRLIQGGMLITFGEVTREKELEAAALNAMLEGQETERKRISKEIHDSIGPALSTIKVSMEALQTKLPKDVGVEEEWAEIYTLLDDVSSDVRSVSHTLTPPALEQFGLIPTFEALFTKLNNSRKIKLHFLHALKNERYDNLIELNLYRVIQELINNAMKHSGAKNIYLQMFQKSDTIYFTAEDDGKGFNLDQEYEHPRGIGLQNMESRIRSIGGVFHIDSTPGKGTIISIEIPLDDEED